MAVDVLGAYDMLTSEKLLIEELHCQKGEFVVGVFWSLFVIEFSILPHNKKEFRDVDLVGWGESTPFVDEYVLDFSSTQWIVARKTE